MNKAELVSAIADKAELSKKDAEAALKAFTDVVTEELQKGEKIQLVGFGTFEVKYKGGCECAAPFSVWEFRESCSRRQADCYRKSEERTGKTV